MACASPRDSESQHSPDTARSGWLYYISVRKNGERECWNADKQRPYRHDLEVQEEFRFYFCDSVMLLKT